MTRKELEKLTTKQLIIKAYAEENEDKYMEYIHILRLRGDSEVFKLTKKLVYSKNSVYRDISASILSQFGYKTKLHKGESVYLLSKLLNDKNEDVISTAIYAFGHRKCTRYANQLASFVTYKSLQIKEALSFSLGGYESQECIDALILLMKDDNNYVRNWSTFSLAQITETNTKKICDALFENLDDKEQEVRGEALLGLASRKDERVKEAILKDLQRPFYGSWMFDSIVEMPDSRYLQYFDTYIDSLDDEDKKAFKRDIEKAKKSLGSMI
jgi:HEAT repeat protein